MYNYPVIKILYWHQIIGRVPIADEKELLEYGQINRNTSCHTANSVASHPRFKYSNIEIANLDYLINLEADIENIANRLANNVEKSREEKRSLKYTIKINNSKIIIRFKI